MTTDVLKIALERRDRLQAEIQRDAGHHSDEPDAARADSRQRLTRSVVRPTARTQRQWKAIVASLRPATRSVERANGRPPIAR